MRSLADALLMIISQGGLDSTVDSNDDTNNANNNANNNNNNNNSGTNSADDNARRRRGATRTALDDGTAAMLAGSLKSMATQLAEFADSTLLTLRVELRLHCLYHLDAARRVSYELSDDAESDAFVRALVDDVQGIEQALAAGLPRRTCRYLFHSLPRLVCTYFLRAVPKRIVALNRHGVVKMHKNLFLLQKQLPSFGALEANNAHFDRVRTFFDLALAPPNELSTLAAAKGFSPQQIATLLRLRGTMQNANQNVMQMLESAATKVEKAATKAEKVTTTAIKQVKIGGLFRVCCVEFLLNCKTLLQVAATAKI